VERWFKSSYNQPLGLHDSNASHIAIYMDTVWYVRQLEVTMCTLMYIYTQWNIDWWPDDKCAGLMLERMFKIIYSSPYVSHKTATSHIVKYWYRTTCPSIWKYNVYINVNLQSMDRRGTSDRIQCQDGVVLAVLSIVPTHTNYRWLRACMLNNNYPSHVWKGISPYRKRVT